MERNNQPYLPLRLALGSLEPHTKGDLKEYIRLLRESFNDNYELIKLILQYSNLTFAINHPDFEKSL